ncbi:MAG: hypothetical protein KAY22_00975 [Rhizorhabdus sp.]|uniref:hypothetical protein n=1 Tax=Rhizorhabdus sp. TaxID=1968843 RepID=UPI001B50882C|nr:hypothetical protein [Rhizorhabdus sp.]MBP8230856.1 hypothetical protein [Rhizorhabdus sp.]
MPGPNAPLVKRLSAIVAGLAIAGFGLYALDRETATPVAPPPPVVEKPVARITKVLPKPEPVLGRTDIIAAVARAADAHAGGLPQPAADRSLVGRTFTLRVPFGCGGPMPEEAPGSKAKAQAIQRGWRYSEASGALQLIFGLDDWTEADWIAPLAGDTPHDQVEGFWLPRPWTSSETCPPAPPEQGEAEARPARADVPAERTVGLAQFFATGAPRTLQRGGRPYSATVKRDAPPAPGSFFHLVVEGRIAAFADGQPIHCQSPSPDQRPSCVVATEFTTMAFEDNSTGEVLARWTK